MTAQQTKYKVATGADLNTIFNPLYLDGTKNLVQLGNTNATITNSTTSLGNYSWVELIPQSILDVTKPIYITINTNITAADDFHIYIVGGGGPGAWGQSTKDSSGGGGGGVIRIIFGTVGLMGVPFNAFIGVAGNPGYPPNYDARIPGGPTILTYSLTNTVFAQAGGGGEGIIGQPDVNFNVTASGTASGIVVDSNYQRFGQIDWNEGSFGGVGENLVFNDGSSKSNGGTGWVETGTPFGTLSFAGGGGGSYYQGSGTNYGAFGGNGTGGLQGGDGTTGGYVDGNGLGQDGQKYGSGGGAGGAAVNVFGSTVEQSGGLGKSGCIYMYWKTRP